MTDRTFANAICTAFEEAVADVGPVFGDEADAMDFIYAGNRLSSLLTSEQYSLWQSLGMPRQIEIMGNALEPYFA